MGTSGRAVGSRQRTALCNLHCGRRSRVLQTLEPRPPARLRLAGIGRQARGQARRHLCWAYLRVPLRCCAGGGTTCRLIVTCWEAEWRRGSSAVWPLTSAVHISTRPHAARPNPHRQRWLARRAVRPRSLAAPHSSWPLSFSRKPGETGPRPRRREAACDNNTTAPRSPSAPSVCPPPCPHPRLRSSAATIIALHTA